MLALTMGDPAGIGPEIALGAWQALRGELPFVLIGDEAMGRPVDGVAEAASVFAEALPVLPVALPVAPVPGMDW